MGLNITNASAAFAKPCSVPFFCQCWMANTSRRAMNYVGFIINHDFRRTILTLARLAFVRRQEMNWFLWKKGYCSFSLYSIYSKQVTEPFNRFCTQLTPSR